MIKTVENIEFNKFVVPSCIDNLDSPRVGVLNELTVAGYGKVSIFSKRTLNYFDCIEN